MCYRRRAYRYVVPSILLILMLGVRISWASSSTEDMVRLIADRLEQSQLRDGPTAGAWPFEEDFAGPATTGMVCAFEWLGEIKYDSCAWRAGYYIIDVTDVEGNVLGDEAYALQRLSDVYSAGLPPDSPAKVGFGNIWYGALGEFYGSLRDPGYEGSTEAYLRHFEDGEPSTTVFYLAHHVLAAYYVNDQDKEEWRDALIWHLSRVDDESSFPVTALGAATWALAKIDALDGVVPVAAHGNSAQWRDVVLADLPALLLSHQVPEDAPLAGSFYWRFDHGSGEGDGLAAGYTEDTVFGLLGLVGAASLLEDGPAKDDMERAIAAAQEALLRGVGEEGEVYEHLSHEGETYHAYAGELLQALWSVQQYYDGKPGSQEQP